MKGLLISNKVTDGPKGFRKGTKLTIDEISKYTLGQSWQFVVSNQKIMTEIEILKKEFDEEIKRLQVRFEEKVDKIQDGDELLPGVLKMVKVFVAVKRKLQPGDKMAGRHGNKGVISRISLVEDMGESRTWLTRESVELSLAPGQTLNTIPMLFETHGSGPQNLYVNISGMDLWIENSMLPHCAGINGNATCDLNVESDMPRVITQEDAESGIGGMTAIISILALLLGGCLLYTSPSPRDQRGSRMPASA